MANHEYKDTLVENVSFIFIYILFLKFHFNQSEAFMIQCNVFSYFYSSRDIINSQRKCEQ